MSEQERIPDAQAAAELIELYYQKGWTDGLPIIPPHESSVNAMLAGEPWATDEVGGRTPRPWGLGVRSQGRGNRRGR